MNNYFVTAKSRFMNKRIISYVLVAMLLVLTTSCSSDDSKADAYGNFEAIETIISAEANGQLISFDVSEGNVLSVNAVVGLVDTVQLHYQKLQVLSKKAVIQSKFSNVIAQVDVINEQIATLDKEKLRVESLLKSKAATQKQLDDIVGQMNILNKQMMTVKTQNASIFAELESVESSLDIIEDQILRAIIENPVNGTVLEKYAEPYELVNAGKPLYKIADLSEMILRAYVSGDQLDDFSIGQKVKVEIDSDAGSNHTYEGEIIWVSAEAEFTPKIIQTKEERVNLVYAIKVKVVNDGKIKNGMPGEVWL